MNKRPMLRLYLGVIFATVCLFGGAPTLGQQIGPNSVETPLLRVRIETPNAPVVADQLYNAHFDVLWGTINENQFEVIVSDSWLQMLIDDGYNPQVISVGRPFKEIQEEQIAKLNTAVTSAAIPAGYKDGAGILAEMNAAANNYPSLCKVVNLTTTYGMPTTVDGNHMYAVMISDNVSVDEDEPAYLLTAQHHAREVVNTVLALYAIEQFTTQYSSDPAIKALVDEYEIWIQPIANPDGYEYVYYTDNNWRKNRRNFGSDFGVDLNRNYPFGWTGACNGNDSTSSNSYRGPSAASEVETQTNMAWSIDRHFSKVLDFHSAGQETLYSYGDCWNHPFIPFLRLEAINLSTASGYGGDVRTSCCLGQHSQWNLSRGAHSFLTETSSSWQPTYAVAVSESVQVFPSVIWQLERAVPLSGHVTDINSGLPVAATINYIGMGFQNGETLSSDGRFGRYHLFVPDGTYTLEFSAPNYLTQQHSISVISNVAKIFDVALVPGQDPPPDQGLPVVITDLDNLGGPFVCSDNACTWTSGVFSIAGASGFVLSADIECIGIDLFEDDDYLTISYRIDNGSWIPLIELYNDFLRTTFTASLIASGQVMQLKIESETSHFSETYLVHELMVEGEGDIDGDGFSNDVEIAAGTNPNNDQDTPVLNVVWVDFGWSDPPYSVKAATEANPLDTLEEAIAIIAPNGTIKFKVTAQDWGGFTGTIDTPMTLAVPTGGDPVRIGENVAKSQTIYKDNIFVASERDVQQFTDENDWTTPVDDVGIGFDERRARHLSSGDVDIRDDEIEASPSHELAQALLEDFTVGGLDGNGRLSFAEAQRLLPGLTHAEFAALDTDGDGELSRAELEAVGAVSVSDGKGEANNGGCFGGSKVLANLKDFLGDLFLLGLLTIVLISWRGFGVRQ